MFRRTLGNPALFTVVYAAVASAVYFSLGVVAKHALGLTPVVFLAAGLFYVLCAMTYVEGASLHQDRGGSTVFARYAFNELWSFVAGWAILLDYFILIAICALSATHYLAEFWAPLDGGTPELVVTVLIIAGAAMANVRGLNIRRLRRVFALTMVDIAVQLLIIVLGLALVFDGSLLVDPIDLGTSPELVDVIFAMTVASVAFVGLESASGLAGEVAVGRRGLKRLVSVSALISVVIYVGIAVVALSALPVSGGETALATQYLDAPILGVADNLDPGSVLSDVLVPVVAVVAALTLVAGVNGATLGMSRLGYQLATNRQIPSAIGRLHPTRSTPFVIIAIAAVLATALVVPRDLDFLIGIYAFGAMLAFTIAHVSVIALRFREPSRDRPYRVPLSVRVGSGSVPIPAVAGAVASFAGWLSVLVFHEGARWFGLAWMAFGLVLYLAYRLSEGKPVFTRVTIPERALRSDAPEWQFGSILVPVTGKEFDDDIVQTAGRLASDEQQPEEGDGGAVIEALWVFEIPMSLPIDAALPDGQLEHARAALKRAKAVGEEYDGVEVATATVRARRAGQAIVDEARRRGVEAIVLAAEEPSRVRGGALLGGRGGPLDNYVGDVTKYVVTNAPCRVILTAPPSRRREGATP